MKKTIFEELDNHAIPYSVVRYKLFNRLITKEIGYEYIIIVWRGHRFRGRHMFHGEDSGSLSRVVYKYLTVLEFEYFRTKRHQAVLNNADGTVWEFNGGVRKDLEIMCAEKYHFM